MSVASAIYNETCHVCEVVGKYLSKSLKKIQYGLQMSANRRVARELAHLGFHQQKEYNQILQQLNDKTNEEYHSRY
tara:strand:- start:288 stop:515 length:228 start_codon:yes stop_codon:yes gene_type:complete